MKTSAGLILTNGEQLLVGHVTGQNHYDIPKGGVEEGETPLDACIREVKEESGLEINASDIHDLGVFAYNSKKRLHLFTLITKELPSIDSFQCLSTFTDEISGKGKLELDWFDYIHFTNVDKYCSINMARVLKNIYDAGFIWLAQKEAL